MTAWTTITNALVAVGAKPFATTIQALRDNPIAIAEGAAGAPRIHPAALDTYRGMVSISGTTPQQFLNLDRFAAIRADYFLASVNVTSPTDFQVGYSNDNGATWGSYQAITPAPTNNATPTNQRDVQGNFRLNLVTGLWISRAAVAGPSGTTAVLVNGAGTHTVPANCNAVRFRFSAAAGNTGNVEIVGLSGVS